MFCGPRTSLQISTSFGNKPSKKKKITSRKRKRKRKRKKKKEKKKEKKKKKEKEKKKKTKGNKCIYINLHFFFLDLVTFLVFQWPVNELHQFV